MASTSLIVPPAALPPPARVRRLLCAIDFSNASSVAVAAAVGMARACGAEMTILFVLPYGRHASSGPSGAVAPDGVRSAVAEDLEALLGPARAAGVVVRVCLKAGDPAREILEEIRRTAPDIVVMGTHSRSRLSRRALGSVSDEVLRGSPRPVLTIACGSDDSDLPASLGGVLCAVDLDDSAVTAIEWASTVARARAVPLTILHVAAGSRGSVEDARGRLRLLAARAGLAKGAAEELVVHGEPSRQVLRQAAARGAGLLVVALRRRDDDPRIDAATNRLIRGASCAVLAIPVVGS